MAAVVPFGRPGMSPARRRVWVCNAAAIGGRGSPACALSCIVGHGVNGQNIAVLLNDNTGWLSFALPSSITVVANVWYTMRVVGLDNGMLYVWEFQRGAIPPQ